MFTPWALPALLQSLIPYMKSLPLWNPWSGFRVLVPSCRLHSRIAWEAFEEQQCMARTSGKGPRHPYFLMLSQCFQWAPKDENHCLNLTLNSQPQVLVSFLSDLHSHFKSGLSSQRTRPISSLSVFPTYSGRYKQFSEWPRVSGYLAEASARANVNIGRNKMI